MTGHVSRVYCVSAVLFLQFVLHVMLSRISNLRNMYAVTRTAVSWSSLISCFPGMLLRYCLSDFEMVPLASVLIGITFTFTLTEFLLQGLRIL